MTEYDGLTANQRYYRRNRDRERARVRAYHHENREKRLSYMRRWYSKAERSLLVFLVERAA